MRGSCVTPCLCWGERQSPELAAAGLVRLILLSPASGPTGKVYELNVTAQIRVEAILYVAEVCSAVCFLYLFSKTWIILWKQISHLCQAYWFLMEIMTADIDTAPPGCPGREIYYIIHFLNLLPFIWQQDVFLNTIFKHYVYSTIQYNIFYRRKKNCYKQLLPILPCQLQLD